MVFPHEYYISYYSVKKMCNKTSARCYVPACKSRNESIQQELVVSADLILGGLEQQFTMKSVI